MASEPPNLGAAATQGFATIVLRSAAGKKYYVHKALLMHHSEYFRKALQGPWKEAEEGLVTLEDVKEGVMNIFVHWLYTQSLPYGHFEENAAWSPIMSNGADQYTWMELSVIEIEAYSFGDRFMAPGFRRDMSKAIVDDIRLIGINTEEFEALTKCAWEIIPLDRPFLQLIVDNFCMSWSEANDRLTDVRALSNMPERFIRRALRRYAEVSKDSEKEGTLVRCYYEHASKDEQDTCLGSHMKYNEERDFGYFD